jgi:hypothetical protein
MPNAKVQIKSKAQMSRIYKFEILHSFDIWVLTFEINNLLLLDIFLENLPGTLNRL